jgi:hypothetical protein
MRHLTPLASERRSHLTENGAVTLCGRAITHKWRRHVRADDRACEECRARAAVQVAPRHERAGDLEPAVPA